MVASRSKSLFQETVTTLILCGLVLFAIGLFISEQFADEQLIQMVLAGSTVVGGILLALALGRIRNRMVVADLLDRQLTVAGKKADRIVDGGMLSPIMTKTLSGAGWNALVKIVEAANSRQRLFAVAPSRQALALQQCLQLVPEGPLALDETLEIQDQNITVADGF